MSSPYNFDLVGRCQDCSLRRSGFFCDLPELALKEFSSIKFTTAYPPGAVLFAEGGPPRGVFMLCRGKVKLSITSQSGKVLILGIARPGEVLGTEAVVPGRPFYATAETLEPCQVNYVARDQFVRFLHENVEASRHLAHQLGRSYQLACDQIRLLGLSQSAPERLARFLLEWAGMGQGQAVRSGVKLTLTHEEIGQVIGTSRETVTRILSEFRTKQLLVVRGSTLHIRDRKGLENFVTS